MQHSLNDIKEKLLKALDKDNNVVDMATVSEVISILERTQITKEALEKTRLGKYINDLRKKTKDETLARRAKELVRRWRKLILPQENNINGERVLPGSLGTAGPGPGPGHSYSSSSSLKPNSPAQNNHRLTRGKPASPLASVSHQGCSPISSHSSSTSTSPALTSGLHSSRPGTPIQYGSKKVSSAEQISPRLAAHCHTTNFVNYHQVSPVISNSRAHPPCELDFTASKERTKSPNVDEMCRSNKNKSKPSSPALLLNDKVVRASHSLNTELVARTIASNKRFRKDAEDAPHNDFCKKTCNDVTAKKNAKHSASGILNGLDCGDSNDSMQSHNESCRDYKENEIKVPSETSKRSDIKNSVRLKKEIPDSLKEKIATHARTPKVKTTAQLIEELKARSTSVSLNPSVKLSSIHSDVGKASSSHASPGFPRRPTNNVLGADHDVKKTKTELMEKFLEASVAEDKEFHSACRTHTLKTESPTQTKSTSGPEAVAGPSHIYPVVDPVETILAMLPPINPDEIDWDDDYPEPKIEPLTDDMVDRYMNEHWEGMNGNCDDNMEFREWHEALTKKSSNGETLHILPYVNID